MMESLRGSEMGARGHVRLGGAGPSWQALGRCHGQRLCRGLMLASCASLAGCAAIAVSAVGAAAAGAVAAGAGAAAYSTAFRLNIVDMTTLSKDDVQKVSDVRLVSHAVDPKPAAIGRFQGLACQVEMSYASSEGRWWPRPSEANGLTPEEVALRQLQLKAFRAGGNALVNWSCVHHDKIDWLNNCFETWVCSGEAIHMAEE